MPVDTAVAPRPPNAKAVGPDTGNVANPAPAASGAAINGAEPPNSSLNLSQGDSVQPACVGSNCSWDRSLAAAYSLSASAGSLKPILAATSPVCPPSSVKRLLAAAKNPERSSGGRGSAKYW